MGTPDPVSAQSGQTNNDAIHPYYVWTPVYPHLSNINQNKFRRDMFASMKSNSKGSFSWDVSDLKKKKSALVFRK